VDFERVLKEVVWRLVTEGRISQAGGDLRCRHRRLLRRLRIFGQLDKSEADRSRKSVKVGANGNQHSAAFKE
jgi:hypothetical protein